MPTKLTDNVFGAVTKNNIVESYVEREKVDGDFKQALKLNKQIVIYGSSKQGKTSLINKHLTTENITKIDCSPITKLKHIYSSILRQNNVQIITTESEQETKSTEIGGSAKVKFKIPLVTDVEAGGSGTRNIENSHNQESEHITYDLNHAQDIVEILNKNNFDKYIVLDNFHYLEEDVQRDFAFDLRIFQENNIKFIILGIWRERNRLSQFNGDLQDRLVEVPVEPWERHDFEEVLKKGSKSLNTETSEIFAMLVESSFDSIGVFQELCKEAHLAANVLHTLDRKKSITEENVKTAILKKVEDYSSRHIRSFETFADSPGRARSGKIPLFIPYYFIRVLLCADFKIISKGLTRKYLHERIMNIHHRPSDVRSSDMKNFLHSLSKYQFSKNIKPALFDFDPSINTLKIMDSTLYFFLRNCDRKNVEDVIALNKLD